MINLCTSLIRMRAPQFMQIASAQATNFVINSQTLNVLSRSLKEASAVTRSIQLA
jgi:hypothetical protein